MGKIAHTEDDFDAAYNDESIDRIMAQITPEEQEDTDSKMKLAAKIYKGMKRKGWSQTRFAEVANQHVSVISRWLSGTNNFTVDTLLEIQRMLGINLLNPEDDVRSTMNLNITIKDSPALSKEAIHQLIYEAGGMAPTSVEMFKVES
jgi:transcriptional regulator with XRE-family HTH domain